MKYSSDAVINQNTGLENVFITEYMPKAPDFYVKVYLYGLYLCGKSESGLRELCRALEAEEDKVKEAFEYWDKLGLVTILRGETADIVYNRVKKAAVNRKYDIKKYENFNNHIQAALIGRMITPNEYQEYYALLEYTKMDSEALALIAGHCAKMKGGGVSSGYILTVARNWAAEGILTLSETDAKILEYERTGGDLKEIYQALGLKGKGDIEDSRLLSKWLNKWGFDKETVIFSAKTCKRGGIGRLDAKLKSHYESGRTTWNEIEAFERKRAELFETAKTVNKIIGVYYEQLDYIVEAYYSVWTEKGFTADA
ncbi:MAG: DnaD domain protein, partial [Firmicutes bacterium]|nr:DnaD domain protein [Bacillota bacterium]